MLLADLKVAFDKDRSNLWNLEKMRSEGKLIREED